MTENSHLLFRPQEIVYIENNEFRLFAEVIQTIPDRDRCWVKPLALAQYTDFQFRLLYNLQECAQLILPLNLFRSALDTEVIPVMMELFQLEKIPDRCQNGNSIVGYSTGGNRQALHHFISNLSIE
jgi:hypothetical protein